MKMQITAQLGSRRTGILRSFALLAIGLLAGVIAAAQELAPPRPVVMSAPFFGMHAHWVGSPTRLPPHVGSWRLWDARVQWAHVEPERGQFDFRLLDQYVEIASRSNVALLLPLGLTPAWASNRPTERSSYKPGNAAPPTDPLAWINYVETVARRYRGRIAAYEMWNEPDVPSFYSGSIPELVELQRLAHEAVKRVDPAAVFVSAAPSANLKWFEKYLDAGGATPADVIGFHFYTPSSRPEAIIHFAERVRGMLSQRGVSKPIWNTETGWRIAQRKPPSVLAGPTTWTELTEKEAANFILRSWLLAAASGIERYYWYAWDNGDMGLQASANVASLAGQAFIEASEKLTGWSVKSCQRVVPSAMWQCDLLTPSHAPARAIWSEVSTIFGVPPALRRQFTGVPWHTSAVSCSRADAVLRCDGPVILQIGT
jgi:hypothetical protein